MCWCHDPPPWRNAKIAHEETEGYGEDERNRSSLPGEEEEQATIGEGCEQLMTRTPLCIVVDAEWVYEGIMEWGDLWRRHNWHISSGGSPQGSMGAGVGNVVGSMASVFDPVGAMVH